MRRPGAPPVLAPATRRAAGPWPDARQALLLDAALGDRARATAAFARWRETVAPTDLDPASRRILPLAFWNLERHGVPRPDLDDLKRAYAESWIRFQQIRDALGRVLGAFQDAGIPVILFKGAALALGTYPQPGLRPMVDVDVLVPPDAGARVDRVLDRIGARRTSKDPEGRRAMLHATEYLLEVGGPPLAVDVHRSLLWEGRRPGEDDEFRSAAVPVPGAPARMLCPADELLVVCVHGLRWSQVRPVYWVADAMMLIRNETDPVDWARLVAEARRRRLSWTLAVALRFLVGAFDAPVRESTLAELEGHGPALRDRLELFCRSRPPQLLRGLLLHWYDHARISGDLSAAGRLATFPGYLRDMWDVRSLRAVPALALRKALHGVGSRPVDRQAGGAEARPVSDSDGRG